MGAGVVLAARFCDAVCARGGPRVARVAGGGLRAQGSRGAARAALSHGSRAPRAAVLRRGPQVAPATVRHKLDLGKVASPYRLTFLVDLPEVFVVKQPFRPLLAGIGRPVCSEVARLSAHMHGSSGCYHNKSNSS